MTPLSLRMQLHLWFTSTATQILILSPAIKDPSIIVKYLSAPRRVRRELHRKMTPRPAPSKITFPGLRDWRLPLLSQKPPPLPPPTSRHSSTSQHQRCSHSLLKQRASHTGSYPNQPKLHEMRGKNKLFTVVHRAFLTIVLLSLACLDLLHKNSPALPHKIRNMPDI